MMRTLQILLELQAIDVRLNAVRALLAVYPKKLADADARVAAAKAQLSQSKAAQVAVIKDRKKYELDVEQWKERARKYRDQTSQVKTNEAYKALQHETQNAEEEIAKAEDRLLDQMVAGEEYDRQIKGSELVVKEVEAAMGRERSGIQTEKAAAEKEFAELNAARALAVAKVSENLLDHYERIIKKHNGIALAEVRDEKCAACGMRIRPHVFQEMRRANSEEMFHCETCTRILYYIEPETPGASTAAPDSKQAAASAPSSREN
jgi:predicted  nucleic acid-binding Zn-ribbon protein